MVVITKATTYNEALGEIVGCIAENNDWMNKCFNGDISGRNERTIQRVYAILGRTVDGRIVLRKTLNQMVLMPFNADPRADAERCMEACRTRGADILADGRMMVYAECALYEVSAKGANILTIHEYKE